MITIEGIYNGDLRTGVKHLLSGTELITDAPVDNEGLGQAFSPTDLMAASLGSCMLTIMGIVARRHHINIEGTTIKITKIMTASPRRVAEIHLLISLPKYDFTIEQKKLIEHAAINCPVAKSLHSELKQEVEFRY
jgi:putative redox protein